MTALDKTVIICNYSAKDAPKFDLSCWARFEDFGTATEVRKKAKTAGWTATPPVFRGSRHCLDYCPAHKPPESEGKP